MGNSIVGAIQQGQEDRKVNDSLQKAGIDPSNADDPRLTDTLLKTTRGLVQQGYDPSDIAAYIGDADIQSRVFGGANVASQAIAGFSEDDVESLRGSGPVSSSSESTDGDITEIVVTGRNLDAVDPFVDNVLHPIMGAASALGDFAAQHETLATLATAGTQIALMGPAQFVKSTVVDAVVGNTVGPYMDRLNSYIQEKAATWIGDKWGFDSDEASFLAQGVAFGGQIVLDSAKNIIGSAKNISSIYRGGPHGQTSLPRNDGLDSHHLPAASVSGLPYEKGPAIQMDPADHWATSSNGRNGAAGNEYRAEIKDLIDEGRMRDAMATEVRDVRRAAQTASGDRTKYNEALQQALKYAKGQGYIPPKPPR